MQLDFRFSDEQTPSGENW